MERMIAYYLEEMSLLYRHLFTENKLDKLCEDDAELLKRHPLMSNQYRVRMETFLRKKSSICSFKLQSRKSLFRQKFSGTSSQKRRDADFLNISFAVSLILKILMKNKNVSQSLELQSVKRQSSYQDFEQFASVLDHLDNLDNLKMTKASSECKFTSPFIS